MDTDDCQDVRSGQASPQSRRTGLPLAPGRDIAVETLWNAWTEATFVSLSDRRFGLDTKNNSGALTIGLDRQLTEDIVAGFSIGGQGSRGHGFNGFTHSNSDGVTLGPYAAARLSPHWAIDTSFSYAQSWTDLQIAVLSGTTVLQSYTGTVELHGQYTVDEWYLRPKFSASYTHSVTDAHDLQGVLLGLPLTLSFPSSASNLGIADAYGEVSRMFSVSPGLYVIPYAELGVHYAFDRPNGGAMLTGDLLTAVPSAWVGSLRTGARVQLPNNMLLEASVGYLSFGQGDLDIWGRQVPAIVRILV